MLVCREGALRVVGTDELRTPSRLALLAGIAANNLPSTSPSVIEPIELVAGDGYV
jgi:hypothetical protein